MAIVAIQKAARPEWRPTGKADDQGRWPLHPSNLGNCAP